MAYVGLTDKEEILRRMKAGDNILGPMKLGPHEFTFGKSGTRVSEGALISLMHEKLVVSFDFGKIKSREVFVLKENQRRR